MRRRDFITLVGGAAAAPGFLSLSAHAQQQSMPRVGVLVGSTEGDPEGEKWVQALLEALPDYGWKPGTNMLVDVRWGSTDLERIQKMAKELLDLKPDVIQVSTTPATAAILRETKTIPVVFSIVSDPIGSGFAQSFSHPGGNATGFVNIEDSVAAKWLELLKQIAPATSRVALMFNPATAPQTPYYQKALETAAAALKLNMTAAPVTNAQEIEATIVDLARPPVGGLIVTPDLFTLAQAQSELIIALTARHRVPAVYTFASFVRAGGLICYGVDLSDLQRRAAGYVDRILRGTKPQDLPVQLPTKFQLAINLKTAKAAGFAIPASVLATADEVVE
jgi:putative tryptophan/tyrosine transport system substrate-binding protein